MWVERPTNTSFLGERQRVCSLPLRLGCASIHTAQLCLPGACRATSDTAASNRATSNRAASYRPCLAEEALLFLPGRWLFPPSTCTRLAFPLHVSGKGWGSLGAYPSGLIPCCPVSGTLVWELSRSL